MSIKTGRKIGFFAALAMLIGSVVGIGIFFKSHSILSANSWNGTGTLIAWVLGGILSLAAAVSFSEMGSMKTKNVHGFVGWSEKTCGKRVGYFTRFNYSFFYFGLLAAILGIFGSEMIFMFATTFSNGGFAIGDIPIYAHILLGLFISASFLTLNILSVKASGYVALVSTILKWIPLILVGVAGIILATTNNAPSKNPGSFGHNAFTNGQSFSFTGMLAALPAVLFAFDAFLGVASMKEKMEKPKKLPLVVIVGMASVLVLYIIIALSAILHGSGMVSGRPFGKQPSVGLGIFDQIFSADVASVMGKIVVTFLVISTLGVVNGVSAASIAVHEQALNTKTFIGTTYATKKVGSTWTLAIYTAIVTVFWIMVVGIPAIILDSDAIIDGMSNFPTLFFFGLYAIVILAYTIKRKTLKTTKMNNIVFKTFAYTAIVGISLVVIYQIFFGFFINAMIHPNKDTSWGLFAENHKMFLWQASIIMMAMLGMFFGLPVINRLLKKKFEKEEVIIDTQK